jgi:hypothetical protein
MSTLEPALPRPQDVPARASESPLGRAAVLEALLERAGEWFNPILVKECRQAMKSRQFVATFAALLAGGWLWSIIGIAMVGPNAYYSFSGPEMFFGYYLVLSFPLLVIVPYTTFRSLAAEWEDRTFELVSITTLHPRQIVAGKLGSAITQMIVYFSALSPCLAFTYLLRGIDIVTIAFVMAYLFLASLALSTGALLFSTAAREKHWQVVLSIGLLIALLYFFAVGCAVTLSILGGDLLAVDQPVFWIAHAAMLTAYVSYFALFFLASAAQLTFASDNRSTALRVTMLIQFLLFAGWMAGLAAADINQRRIEEEFVVVFVVFAGMHWYVMGAMMVLERPGLSPRVKRSLPQTFLGRIFLTWFSPGPGTGYLFAVSNLLATAYIGWVAALWLESTGRIYMPGPGSISWYGRIGMFIVLGVSYVIFYLGFGKLLVGFLRPMLSTGFISGMAVQLLLLLLGTGVPLIIHGFSSQRGLGYTLLQITNPFWTLSESFRTQPGISSDLAAACYLVPLLAVVALVLNLPSVLREVRQIRIAAPPRVLQDEATSQA